MSVLRRPKELQRVVKAESAEKIRSDRIWKHGVWLTELTRDFTDVARSMYPDFEIDDPRTPVLEASRL